MATCKTCELEFIESKGFHNFCTRKCRSIYAGSKLKGIVKKRVKCQFCGKDFSKNQIRVHSIICSGGVYPYPKDFMTTKISCNICKKQYSILGIRSHVWRCHTQEGHKFGAKLSKIFKKNPRPSWNKGLTKQTSDIIRRAGIRLSERYKKGELKPSKRTWSFELRKSHSEKAKKRGFGGTTSCKHFRYVTRNGEIVSLQSTFEVCFAQNLDSNLVDWIRPKFFWWVDSLGEKHRYYPDFYIPSLDVYVDPKNDYLIVKDEEKIKQVALQNKIKLVVLSKQELDIDSLKNKLGQLA